MSHALRRYAGEPNHLYRAPRGTWPLCPDLLAVMRQETLLTDWGRKYLSVSLPCCWTCGNHSIRLFREDVSGLRSVLLSNSSSASREGRLAFHIRNRAPDVAVATRSLMAQSTLAPGTKCRPVDRNLSQGVIESAKRRSALAPLVRRTSGLSQEDQAGQIPSDTHS